jgi:hypothetical protein
MIISLFSNASKDSLWSNIVIVPSCSKDQSEDTTFTADLKFPNGNNYYQ